MKQELKQFKQTVIDKDEPKDFSPPAWIVYWFDQVRLDPERAEKFHNLRNQLCDKFGKENELCFHNNLWMRALDLLINDLEKLLKEDKWKLKT